MIKVLATILLTTAFAVTAHAQLFKMYGPGDSNTTISLEGYVDAYFGFDFNQPKDANRPYAVSYHRHNEVNINLAYLSLKYNAPRARASFTPGFGTYMNANYAAERVTLKNILEANVGVKLFKKKNIWLDVGVFGAPYSPESAIAFDQLMYTRGFAGENSPYYLTGGKLTLPLGKAANLYLYLVNGWQVIEDVNAPLAFASQLELRPSEKTLINWSTYIGNEQSASTPDNRERYFTDLYFIYTPTGKLTLAVDIYAGSQKRKDSLQNTTTPGWAQANLTAKYALTKNDFLSGRIEYFGDQNSVIVVPITNADGYDCYSYSLGYTRMITNKVMLRMEGRYFYSTKDIFYNETLQPVNSDMWLIGGVVAKF